MLAMLSGLRNKSRRRLLHLRLWRWCSGLHNSKCAVSEPANCKVRCSIRQHRRSLIQNETRSLTGTKPVSPASASTPEAVAAGKMSEDAETTWGMLPPASWSRLPRWKPEPRELEDITRGTCCHITICLDSGPSAVAKQTPCTVNASGCKWRLRARRFTSRLAVSHAALCFGVLGGW